MNFRLTLTAIVLLGAISLEAHAQQQPWLADRKYGEGMGVRVGNLELHPSLAGEFGYDSNYFLRSTRDAIQPDAAFRIRVTPSISLSTLGAQRQGAVAAPQTVNFRGGAYVTYNELIAAESRNQSEFSDQRHLDVGGDLLLNVFPMGRFGFDTNLDFVRIGQPSNDPGTENAFDRDLVRAGAGLTWRPGGGLFDWRLGYEFLYNYFERSAFTYLNNYQNTVNMRGRWRFLPRTALLYDGAYTWITYPHESQGPQNNGTIVSSRIGMNGLITSRFSLLGLIGWAGTFYDAKGGQAPQQFDSITGQAELKWFITGVQDAMNPASAPVGLSYASLGYTRNVENSYLGNYYQRDRGYVGISYLLGGVLVTNVAAGFSNLTFPTSYFGNGGMGGPPVVQHSGFSEQRVDASVFAEYRLSNTVGLNATVLYDQAITDVAIPTDPSGTAASLDYLDFKRWQAYLGARWFL